MMKRPVHILTGFLGSGKTTLLNRILQGDEFANTAVIINEFGEVGIDHLLVDHSDDQILELSNGCLCCTIRGELIDTITNLLSRNFDRLVIETTGLANPVPVAQAIIGHPELSQVLELRSILTMVDGIHGGKTLDENIEAQQQVAMATDICISKLDLLNKADAATSTLNISRRIAELNPLAIVSEISVGPSFQKLFSDNRFEQIQPISSIEQNGHSHHNHNKRIRSLVLRHTLPIPIAAMERFMELVTSAHSTAVLRIKGVVWIEEHPDNPLVVHGVQSVFHPPSKLESWPDGVPNTELVVITQDFDPAFIEKLFAGFINCPTTDTPDRVALMQNPLAISGHRF